MKTFVEFRSEKFPACTEEDDLINPNVFGKRLAEYWVNVLTKKGYVIGELIPEDWGWIVPIKNFSFSLWIGCANYGESGGFLCHINPHTPYVRKWFKKIDSKEMVENLQRAMDEALSSDRGIESVKWSTYDEFTNLGK